MTRPSWADRIRTSFDPAAGRAAGRACGSARVPALLSGLPPTRSRRRRGRRSRGWRGRRTDRWPDRRNRERPRRVQRHDDSAPEALRSRPDVHLAGAGARDRGPDDRQVRGQHTGPGAQLPGDEEPPLHGPRRDRCLGAPQVFAGAAAGAAHRGRLHLQDQAHAPAIRSVLPAGLLVQRGPPRNHRGVMNPRQIAKGLVVAAALTAASGLAGCAGALAVNRRSPGTVENGMFKPSLPPAGNYGPDPGRTCPQRGVFGMVQDQMNERFKGKATPEPEGRLCAMAETLLGWQGADNDFPPESVRQFLSAYFGLPLTVRQMLITNVDSENDRQIADALSAPVASFAANAEVPRYGLVTTRVKKGVTKAVLVMQDQALELSQIPRKLAPGSSATLEGRVRGTIDKPKAEISTVAGKLQSVPPSADKSIRAQLECGDKPGKIVVQITGENEGADVFLASFPVACGGKAGEEHVRA